MGKLTIRKSLRRSSAKVLNFILLFSLIVPNVFTPAMVIAQDLDLVQKNVVTQIPIDESEDILEDGINTSIFEEETLENSFEDGIYTVNTVSLGEYVYPDNPLVKVNFTEITQEGNLVIERVILTQEQKVELNTTESFAWDITSSMSNGTFKYDLTLPNSLGNDIEVKYSEDGSTYEKTGEFTVNEDSLVITDLDHFTTFVVINPNPVGNGNDSGTESCAAAGIGFTCYDTIQGAINAAQANGDTEQDIINIKNGTYNECLNITGTNIKLLGESKNGAIIDNSACPSYGIHVHEADQIEFKTMTIKGSLSSYTFKIANSTNIELRNIIVKDSYRTAIDLNGVNNAFLNSIEAKNTERGLGLMIKDSNNIEIGNIKTENNAWGGVSVQTEGYPYTGGSDNVKFTGTFDASDIIPFFTEQDPHRITGIYSEITNLQAPAKFQYIVYTVRQEDSYKQWFYRETLGESKSVANTLISSVFPTYSDILIFDIAKENYWVIPDMLVQNAVNDATNGDIIHIMDGLYEEQILVTEKDIKMTGESEENTRIVSPLTLSTTFETLMPIISTSLAKLDLENLTVDGLGRGNGNYRMVGIGLLNSSGSLNNVSVINIKETPASGAQHGVGIYAYNSDSVERTLAMNSITIHDYQKNGLNLRGEGLTANINNSLIYGFGAIDFIAQNGIQYSEGATGTIENNEIYGNLYTPSSWAATGILPYEAGDNLKIINNNIHDNGWGGIYAIGVGDNLEILNNHIHDNLGDGIILYDGLFENALIKGNTIEDNDYGIWLDSGISNTLRITENFFDNKEENATDDGAYYFDNGVKGNYWSDYTGFDVNGDGIGETPYAIDGDSSDRYPLTNQYLSATVNSVNAQKEYYKEGDILSIDVEVTNNGSIALDPTKEQLVINITNPNGSYISGTFRGKVLLDLQAGETRTFQFYATEQTIPDTWIDGTYRIHTSIYSQRSFPLNYLLGGQNSSETFIVDSIKPSTPSFFAPVNNLFTNVNFIKLEWTGGDDLLSGVKGYILGYTFTPSNGGAIQNWNTGLREVGNPYWHSGTYGHGEGKYELYVKTVDNAGNMSETSELLTVTYDKTGPVAPSIIFPSEDQYFNTTPILNDWNPVSDPSGVKEYRIEYVYDDHHTFSGAPYRTVTSTQRNHTPGSWEQGGVTIRVQAFDNIGNEGAWSDPVHYFYDATGPEITFSGLRYINSTTIDSLSTITNDNTPIIIFTVSDVLGTVSEASVNGDSATYDGTHWNAEITTPLPNGTNTLSIKAKDNAGNENEIPQDIFVDTNAPTATHTYLKDSVTTTDTTYVKGVNQLSFTATYEDTTPSSGMLQDSFVIFDSNEAGTARTSKAYCGWRSLANTPKITGYSITTPVQFTDCEPTLLDGEYFMYHQVYDNATRKDIPSITQFRDVKGLHFIVDAQAPTVAITNPIDGSTVSGTVDFKGTVQDDNLSSYSYEISRLTDIISGGENTETGLTNQTIYSWNTTTYPNGVYQIKLKATDKADNETEEVINVTVNNPVQQQEAGQVAGATTENTPTNSPTLVRRVTTYVADVLGIGGGEDELLTQLPEETEESEVKGSQTCDNPKLLSGYVYMDENENSMWDEDEKIFSDISLRIYTVTDGIEETVKQVLTDENGYWEAKLCMGEYSVSLDSETLPNMYIVDGDETKGIDISDMESEYNLNYQILDNRNFLQKYWPWILLLVGLIGTGVIVVADSKKRKNLV